MPDSDWRGKQREHWAVHDGRNLGVWLLVKCMRVEMGVCMWGMTERVAKDGNWAYGGRQRE